MKTSGYYESEDAYYDTLYAMRDLVAQLINSSDKERTFGPIWRTTGTIGQIMSALSQVDPKGEKVEYFMVNNDHKVIIIFKKK